MEEMEFEFEVKNITKEVSNAMVNDYLNGGYPHKYNFIEDIAVSCQDTRWCLGIDIDSVHNAFADNDSDIEAYVALAFAEKWFKDNGYDYVTNYVSCGLCDFDNWFASNIRLQRKGNNNVDEDAIAVYNEVMKFDVCRRIAA